MEQYFNQLPYNNRTFLLSDGVKFAKYKPLEKDNITAIQTIRNLIEEERLISLNKNLK